LAREQRRLAAIVAADVVGYSRLMGRDESGTFARLRKNRFERLDPVLARYGGRLVKLTGDGALVEFASAVDALSAAIEFQQATADANSDQPADTALVFRMGVHLGDLIVDGDDLYGDGVNVAARLEGEAPAGGIVISRTVHEAVEGRVKAAFDDLGNLTLKNIERSVQAFSVKWEPSDWHAMTAEVAVAPMIEVQAPLLLPDKPSIAVLPFQNMSGDPEQEYFADGMIEDIITALSRFKSLFVIARNSSFTYKGKTVDVKQVGRELGVRYVLEGSVRKAGTRLRVTGQLIDVATGTHLWADRFEGTPDDIFLLQDEVTERVVSAIAPVIEREGIVRARRRPTESVDAVTEHYLGLASIYKPEGSENNERALQHFRRATQIDPEFAAPHGGAAMCLSWRTINGWAADPTIDNEEILRIGQHVRNLETDDAFALSALGWATARNLLDLAAGSELADRAKIANPNFAFARAVCGWMRTWEGKLDEAIPEFERAIRLNPRDPQPAFTLSGMATTLFYAGRYEEAVSWAERSLREFQLSAGSIRVAIAAYVKMGRMQEARKLVSETRRLWPGLRLSAFSSPQSRPQFAEELREALRIAGYPE